MTERIEHVLAGGHLVLGDRDVTALILLVVPAPILVVVWLALMLAGHGIHRDHDTHHPR